MQRFIRKKKEASIIENTLVMLLEVIVVCAFLVVIFGAFAGISDKWGMRQVAREYLLIMETEVYSNTGEKIIGSEETATAFTVYVTPEEVEQINKAVCFGGIQIYLKTE